jgi:hypothetical protein
MKKKIECWIEINENDVDFNICRRKPTARELKNNKEFGYKTYEAVIILGKEIKK